MQRDCALPIAGRGRLTSYSMEYKTGVLGPVDPRDVIYTKTRLKAHLDRNRLDRHIVRNAHVQTTASSATIQAQVAPSLGDFVSSRTIRRRLAEGDLESRCPLRVPSTPPFGVVPCTRKMVCSGMEQGRL
ncbi:HTH_Tnp_Tc3_2 domain-containing protein [Trichonephila clavipes]|nr:HTH_Tnp_Tc3_2 domain-containing protein [Trichonephila clavipes]